MSNRIKTEQGSVDEKNQPNPGKNSKDGSQQTVQNMQYDEIVMRLNLAMQERINIDQRLGLAGNELSSSVNEQSKSLRVIKKKSKSKFKLKRLDKSPEKKTPEIQSPKATVTPKYF